MPIDEKKLRAILAEQEEGIKRHVGLLAEESDRKFGLVQEGFQGLSDKVEALSDKVEGLSDKVGGLSDKVEGLSDKVGGLSDNVVVEFAAIRKEIAELRILLFRKADLERLEAVEKRVTALENRALRK